MHIDPLELVVTRVMRVFRLLRLGRLPFFVGSVHPFTEYFVGFERVAAVRRIFGENTDEVLRKLRVELTILGGYMWVSDVDGHLVVSSRYLSEGDRVDIYLDVIHELTHVKQFMDWKELFDVKYDYIDRPTEVEAYRHAVEEARRLGLSEDRICQHLKTEWMSERDLKQLAKTLNVRC